MDPPDPPPELRDVETKLGRKTPEGLLRGLREEAGPPGGRRMDNPEPRELGEKIRHLRGEMACLRAIDVQILQQLLAVNEGMESVRWILEERGNLTSRCSSLTSSQYSLAGSQETSRRGSWNSLQDPNDKLDSISIGSFLDTLADDLDEYSLSTSEPAVSFTPYRHGQDGDNRRDSLPKVEPVVSSTPYRHGQDGDTRRDSLPKAEPVVSSTPYRHGQDGDNRRDSLPKMEPVVSSTPYRHGQDGDTRRDSLPKMEPVVSSTPYRHGQDGDTWRDSLPKTELVDHVTGQVNAEKVPRPHVLPPSSPSLQTPNGSAKRTPGPGVDTRPAEGKAKAKSSQNGRVDIDRYKVSNKIQLEYDAHWRWVQSQDDVTFL